MSSIVELLVNEGSVILSEPDPLVLVHMFGAVILNASLIVRISNETLIDSKAVVISPELSDIGGNIS